MNYMYQRKKESCCLIKQYSIKYSSYLLAASRQKPCSSIGDMYPRPVNSFKCYYVRRLSLCCYPFNMQLTLTNLCLSEDKINKLILICRETNFTPGY